MSEEPTVLTRLSQIPWLTKWATDASSALGTEFIVDVDGGLIIDPDTDDEALKRAAGSLLASRTRSSQIIRVVDRMLGNLILHHSLKNKVSWAESIEMLELCKTDGRSMRSLSRLPRIVSRLDAEILMLPDLTTKHFDQATAFQAPEDPVERKEWNEKVKDILIEASLDPTERGSSWVSEKMKGLQKEMGIDTGRPEPTGDVLKNIAILSYILNKWTEEDFDTRGIKRGVVVDHYEDLMGKAITRCMIECPDNPVTFIPFWEKKPTTVEVQENDGAK